jgi:hypothetical protein
MAPEIATNPNSAGSKQLATRFPATLNLDIALDRDFGGGLQGVETGIFAPINPNVAKDSNIAKDPEAGMLADQHVSLHGRITQRTIRALLNDKIADHRLVADGSDAAGALGASNRRGRE